MDANAKRNETPSVRETAKGWETRLRFGRGERRWFVLNGCKSKDAAERRASQLARIAASLRRARSPAEAEAILSRAAEAQDAESVRNVAALARRIGRGEYRGDGEPICEAKTFREVAEAWTDGELHRRWPDHVRDIDHQNNVTQLEAYVYATLGTLPVAEVRREHCDRVLRVLPAHLEQNSRRHVAQLVNRVLNLAAFAGYATHNPLPRGWVPRRGAKKDVPVLYPSEDAALLACRTVPLGYRLYYGLLHREGGRRSETAALRWAEIDLENGVIQLDKNKTNHARWWKTGPGVIEALRAWHELRGRPQAEELVFVELSGKALDLDRMAERIREHLELADVKRARLFSKGKNTVRFGTHGFRHSFTTRALASGKTDDWVRQRTGHRSTELLTYREAARSLVELDLGEVAPLVEAIPELAEVHARVHPSAPLEHGGGGTNGTARRAEAPSDDALSASDAPQDGPQSGPRRAQQGDVNVSNSAERQGFEPWEPLRVHMISNHAPSATRSSLRGTDAEVRAVPGAPHSMSA